MNSLVTPTMPLYVTPTIPLDVFIDDSDMILSKACALGGGERLNIFTVLGILTQVTYQGERQDETGWSVGF